MADEEKQPEGVAPEPVPSIETDEGEVEKEGDDAEAAVDGEGSDKDAPADDDDEMIDVNDTSDGKVSNDLYKAYKAITEVLLNFKIKSKGSEEHFPSSLFKRLPNKRLLPEYYEVIKEPSAISTLRGKIQRKQYTGTPEFVRDFALISHNAQVFNRPNSQPVRDVLKLEELFKEELKKLVEEGLATEEEIQFPDLGEIPYSTPEPDPVSEDEDGEEEADGDEDDEDEDADDSDDDKRKRRGRRGTKSGGKKGDDDDDDEKGGDAEQKRRGRPPKVATPMEHRIDRILKSLKKVKSQTGQLMISPFERLPDKSDFPDYYDVIQQPMAFDVLKKKAKRKKYPSIDEFMKDVELMFKNAMIYNEDGSDVYKWAQELLEEARRFETEERAKPDSEYLQAAEGRIPLPHIIYKGDMWKVGDWIHIQNPNDITKPIIAQIYRTWKTANDEEWINACWYYRPEQTVHQYEKHFYPNEVVKTGQYRDHKIEEVLNKCFVMFYTRYSRGRPRDLPPDGEVYVCEARYNEDKFKFNKIKTWASCLPDEVRDKDYEMDLFETPRRIKKVPSPLLSRLKDDAKETDDVPQPEWKHANAPPVFGGIHKRPRDENQSPPPEPTPPPQPAPTPVARPQSATQSNNMRVPVYPQNNATGDGQASGPRPTPSLTPQPLYSSASQFSRQPSFAAATPYNAPTQNNPQPLAPQFQYPQQQGQPTSLMAAHPTSYSTSAAAYGRTTSINAPPVQYNAQPAGMAIQHRTPEAYVLSDTANMTIPKEIRDQFPTDDQGRVLFFTSPPLENRHSIPGSSDEEQLQLREHSNQYMHMLATRKRKREAIGGQDRMELNPPTKQSKPDSDIVDVDNDMALSTGESATAAIAELTDRMKKATETEYKSLYGDQWRSVLMDDLKMADRRRKDEHEQEMAAEAKRKSFRDAHLGRLNGQYGLNTQGYITGWQKDFFMSTYLDDHDSRLPF